MRLRTVKWIMAVMLIVQMSMSMGTVSAAATDVVKIKVTLVSAELTDNNHVGNEWATSFTVNDSGLEEGKSVEVKLKKTEKLTLNAYAEEQDKIPDTGSADYSIKAGEIKKTLKKSLTVTVTENRGRYSGNTATWTFSFTIEKV